MIQFQFAEQMKTDSCSIRRAQLYALYQRIAFVNLHKQMSIRMSDAHLFIVG